MSTCKHDFIKHGDGYRCPHCFTFLTVEQYRRTFAPDDLQVDPEVEAEFQGYITSIFAKQTLSKKQVIEMRLAFIAGMMVSARLVAEMIGILTPKRAGLLRKFVERLLLSSKAANRDRIE